MERHNVGYPLLTILNMAESEIPKFRDVLGLNYELDYHREEIALALSDLGLIVYPPHVKRYNLHYLLSRTRGMNVFSRIDVISELGAEMESLTPYSIEFLREVDDATINEIAASIGVTLTDNPETNRLDVATRLYNTGRLIVPVYSTNIDAATTFEPFFIEGDMESSRKFLAENGITPSADFSEFVKQSLNFDKSFM